jgi:hypothetical protein
LPSIFALVTGAFQARNPRCEAIERGKERQQKRNAGEKSANAGSFR